MRLIDADNLKQKHFMGNECESCINDVGHCQNWHSYTKMDFCGWIDGAPTVDAVEVIRCKDCSHSEWNTEEEIKLCGLSYQGLCRYWNYHSVNKDWFCSKGERKNECKRNA